MLGWLCRRWFWNALRSRQDASCRRITDCRSGRGLKRAETGSAFCSDTIEGIFDAQVSMDPSAPPTDDEELHATVANLVAQAGDTATEVRRVAFEGLYELAYRVGPRIASAIPALMEGMLDPDPKIGESAQWALKYCGADSIAPLVGCLAHPQGFVRERAARSLGNIGDDARRAVPALLPLLVDEDQGVRRQAAWAIGLTHDTATTTINALALHAAQGSSEDRACALHALGNIGHALDEPSALDAHRSLLLEGLDDEDAEVRWSALFAVRSLALAPSAEVALLSKLLQQEASARVMGDVFSRLKELAPLADLSLLVPLLLERIGQPGPFSRHACEVLAAMRPSPPEAIAPLLQLLAVDDLVLPAVKALWKIDPQIERLLPAIERIFDTYDEEACDVICELGPAAAPLLPKLIGALAREDWDLQWAAADALGALASTEPRVVEALLDALGHPSPIVRSASARALAGMGIAVVRRLRHIVGDPLDPRCAWAASALGEMGLIAAEALPELRAGMRGDSRSVSTACAIAIAHVGAEAEAVPYLVAILCSEELHAPRREAARALGELGASAQASIAALEALLDDEDLNTVQAAEEALDAIRAVAH